MEASAALDDLRGQRGKPKVAGQCTAQLVFLLSDACKVTRRLGTIQLVAALAIGVQC